jgi:hypothetical protein
MNKNLTVSQIKHTTEVGGNMLLSTYYIIWYLGWEDQNTKVQNSSLPVLHTFQEQAVTQVVKAGSKYMLHKS